MNSECPIVKPRETNYSNSELTQILERDENGKPKLDLTSLEGTGVRVPTQEEYDILMQVYELGDWKRSSGNLSTHHNYWNEHKEETCVRAEGEYAYGRKDFFISRGRNIISTQKFYEIQKRTLEDIKERNKWFEKVKLNRRSKG